MKIKSLVGCLAVMQIVLSVRVVGRLLTSAHGERLQPACDTDVCLDRVSVLVPVLDEAERLEPCLQGLMAQGPEVAEILVIDGGSQDGTRQIILSYSQRDARIRLVNAAPVDAAWNGKAWGLQVGLANVEQTCEWVLMIDADVRPRVELARSLLVHARRRDLSALSIATLQEIEGFGQGLLHPALLTTLVYRFGSPGRQVRDVHLVQANGQCFLVRRQALAMCGEMRVTYNSVCEDITLARALVSVGYAVGFYEAGELVSVRMYENWRETWSNWTRSLPMRDRFSGWHALSGWLEILFVQTLPLPFFLGLMLTGSRYRSLLALNGLLLVLRLGVLFGTARAYRRRPWSYWLSPCCDLPIALKLGVSSLRRRHTWRGRPLLRGGNV